MFQSHEQSVHWIVDSVYYSKMKFEKLEVPGHFKMTYYSMGLWIIDFLNKSCYNT